MLRKSNYSFSKNKFKLIKYNNYSLRASSIPRFKPELLQNKDVISAEAQLQEAVSSIEAGSSSSSCSSSSQPGSSSASGGSSSAGQPAASSSASNDVKEESSGETKKTPREEDPQDGEEEMMPLAKRPKLDTAE